MMAGGWEGLKKAKKNNIINVLPLTCMSTNSLVCNMLSFYLIKILSLATMYCENTS